MKKLIVLISILIVSTSCYQTNQKTNNTSVTHITSDAILNDHDFVQLTKTLNDEQKVLLSKWLKEKVIPYICYLEVELEYTKQ